jgi:hypothetical protein
MEDNELVRTWKEKVVAYFVDLSTEGVPDDIKMGTL